MGFGEVENMKASEYKNLQNPLSHCAFRIGIDAGIHTGVAIYTHEIGEWNLQTMNFWKAYDFIRVFDPDHTGIVVEVPNSKRIVYDYQGERGTGDRRRERMAANVGSNRREAALLAERFEGLGYPVIRVTPIRHKWSAADLQRELGITSRTNAHVRDAIQLVSKYI